MASRGRAGGDPWFAAFPTMKGLVGADIYTLHADRAGALWIGATGVGVYRPISDEFTQCDETERPTSTAASAARR